MSTVAALVVLGVLLICIIRPPKGLPEIVFAGPAAAVVLAGGLEPWHAAWATARELAPTLVFVAGVFVLAEAADAAGVFERAGDWLSALGNRGDRVLVAAVALLAIAITTVFGLDATVVLFTPVVVRLAQGRRSADAALLATVFLANGASNFLPVANLTNLLVVQRTGLGYGPFFTHMVLPGVVAAAVITVVCVWLAKPRSVSPPHGQVPGSATAAARQGDHGLTLASGPSIGDRAPMWLTTAALVILVGVLAGFVFASAAHVAPAWVAVAGAAVLGGVVWRARRARPLRLVKSVSVGFLAFVLGLAIVVDAAARHHLGAWVRNAVPHGRSLVVMLAVASLAALLANVVNNLPATLLLLPVLGVAPTPVVLAALLGLNIGPNLTYTGSLATLLWRKVVRGYGCEPSPRRFFATAWTASLPALALAVVALWAVT